MERKKKAEEKYKERMRQEKIEERRMKRESVRRHLESLESTNQDEVVDNDLIGNPEKNETVLVKNTFKTTVTVEDLF